MLTAQTILLKARSDFFVETAFSTRELYFFAGL
jgi:hypothetical protein